MSIQSEITTIIPPSSVHASSFSLQCRFAPLSRRASDTSRLILSDSLALHHPLRVATDHTAGRMSDVVGRSKVVKSSTVGRWLMDISVAREE
jgi:hypothetical protein